MKPGETEGLAAAMIASNVGSVLPVSGEIGLSHRAAIDMMVSSGYKSLRRCTCYQSVSQSVSQGLYSCWGPARPFAVAKAAGVECQESNVAAEQ